MATHVGPPRKYFCSTWLTEDRRKFVDGIGPLREVLTYSRNPEDHLCLPYLAVVGDHIRECKHGLLVQRTVRSRQEREYEARINAQLILNLGQSVHIWLEHAKRRCRCVLCWQYIYKDEERYVFAFNFGRFHRRKFVHKTCLFDGLLGGRPGKGCPGCSIKREVEEFKAYRKMLEKRGG